MKTIFIGTGSFAAPVLQSLKDIDLVVTAPDKPAGRKRILTPPPVKEVALSKNIPLIQPEKISKVEFDFQPDLIIVADYGQIIPSRIINLPRLKTINVHPSLLPKYRGPDPIRAPILNGDRKTGITLMLIDEKVDHGPILAQKEVEISEKDNARTLTEKLAREAGIFLNEILPQYVKGEITPREQNHDQATFTRILTREDGKIDFQKETAEEIERKVRAFHPWPGAWTMINNKRIKILKAKITERKEDLTIKTKEGLLKLETIQPEGKKPMSGKEFLAGNIDLFKHFC